MKLLLSILLSNFSISIFSQIPNNSFETWITVNGYEVPSGWDNLNQITFNQNIFTCIKGTPGTPGLSYLYLVSKAVPGKGIVPGRAVTGKIDTATYKPLSGYPFTSRPQNLTYNLQYMPYDASDSSGVSVVLTKWDTTFNKRDTIAFGASYYNAMAHSWFVGSTYLNYSSGDSPDSAVVEISSSSSVPKDGSYIYIDNLQFNGSIVGISEFDSALGNILVYPNPAKNTINISLEGINTFSPFEIKIYNLLGKIVYSGKEIKSKTSINCSSWNSGLYTISIHQDKSSIHKKIIINN